MFIQELVQIRGNPLVSLKIVILYQPEIQPEIYGGKQTKDGYMVIPEMVIIGL